MLAPPQSIQPKLVAKDLEQEDFWDDKPGRVKADFWSSADRFWWMGGGGRVGVCVGRRPSLLVAQPLVKERAKKRENQTEQVTHAARNPGKGLRVGERDDTKVTGDESGGGNEWLKDSM